MKKLAGSLYRFFGVFANTKNPRSMKLFHRFLLNRSGNFAVTTALIFSLVLLPIAGNTLDYYRTIHSKSGLQNKLDSIAFALVKTIDQDAIKNGSAKSFAKESARLRPLAKKYLNTAASDIPFLQSSQGLKLVLTEDYIELSVTGNVKLGFGNFIGKDTNQVPVISQVSFTRTAVAAGDFYFALDHSTSMTGRPEANLRAAAKKFVNKLYEKKADSEISIVPFYQYKRSNRGFYIYNKNVLKEKKTILKFIRSMRAVTRKRGSGSDVYSCSKDVLKGLLKQANKKNRKQKKKNETPRTSTFVLMTDFDNYCPVRDIIPVCDKIRRAGHKLIVIQFGRFYYRKRDFIRCAGDPDNYYYVTTADDIFDAFSNAGKISGVRLSK